MTPTYAAYQLLNTPMAIHRGRMDTLLAALLHGCGPETIKAALLDEAMSDADSNDAGYSAVGGVAVLPIHGVLFQRQPWWGWGVTSYDVIRQALLTALADDRVQSIVFDIDSPGGEVAGCLDLADMIYAARDIKPLTAILTENAYSAAYALASAADRVILPRTGGAGHVGAIFVHYDLSKMYAENGVKPTIFAYGEHKADGRSELPLTDEARIAIQNEVDYAGELIVETVARNRGMDTSAVRDTQARTYLGDSAVKVGFADGVAAPDVAFRAVLGSLNP